ncbi:FecR domain-containing protein [Sphingosinicella sp. CPCC 101087]|uniref:FecR family protein n=1 Tax=Sphingosinicella sp. CPCC 101087 TaxID=2497754 RepID=UPI00101D05DA|nr:FecR domain-containing protein [Sphingosinicella sp. CPCC 101087]
MSAPVDREVERDPLMREAATWFARMRGPDAESHREAFQAWIARGALHRSAYNRAAEIFAMGKLLADEQRPAGDPAPTARSRRSQLVAGLVGLLLLAAAAGWLATRAASSPGQQPAIASRAGGADQILVTGPDQERRVRLADGSTLLLGAGTRLQVRLNSAARDLRLVSGLARFEVAADHRPFNVEAGGGRITARGTIFDIAVDAAQRVTVHLVEGVVDVTLPAAQASSGNAPDVRRLAAGERVSFGAQTGTAGTGAELPVSPGARPVDGDIREFGPVRLADLIAEANRGTARPIHLSNAALGDRRVSGRFRLGNTERLADRLAILLGLKVDRSDPERIVLTAR